MLKICKSAIALAALTTLSFASAPVATVSCTDPFGLDDHLITAPGITSWPLVSGDELETGAAPAILVFMDGSRVKLSAQSRVRVAAAGSQLKVILEAGTLDYKLAVDAKLSVSSSKTEKQPDHLTALKVSYSSGSAETEKAPRVSQREPSTPTNSAHSLLEGLPILGEFR